MLAADLSRTIARIPRPAWNALALVFAVAFGYAAFIAWHDETGDPFVRLAVVIYSLLFAGAVRRGFGWERVGERLNWFWNRFRPTKWFEFCVVASIVSILFAIIFPIFDEARRKADGGQNIGNIKQCGMALLQYAEDWDENLPTHMNTNAVPMYLNAYLSRYATEDRSPFVDTWCHLPFTWRRQMSGLYIDDLLETSQLVVSYSPYVPKPPKSPFRLTLYLDGHVKYVREADFWKAFAVEPKHELKTMPKGAKP